MPNAVNSFSHILKLGLLLLCLGAYLSVAGCVTTTTGGFSADASDEKEIERRVQLASNYLRMGKMDAAKKHLKRALEIDPKSAEVHSSLGLVFQLSGEFELAEEHFKKSIRLDSSYSRGRNNYAVFLYERGRYKEAMGQLEIVVKDTLYENRANAFANLGKCALKLDKREQAQEAYTRALLMERGHSTSMLELAILYFDKSKYIESQRFYDQYRGAARQSARSLWLGVRLARIFEDQNAEASYALALKNLYPKSQQYIDYKSSLNYKNNIGDS